MSYRDDRDADRARIEALEVELASAQRKIVQLEAPAQLALVQTGNALAIASGGQLPWYGAPLRLELVRTFTGEFPRDQLEDLVAVIRKVSRDPGNVEMLKSSLTWTMGMSRRDGGPQPIISVTIRKGQTDLVATDNLRGLAGAVYGGVGGGVGGGAITLPIFVALAASPVLVPVALAAWFGGVFFGARAIFRRSARQRAKRLHAVFAALATEIERGIPAL